MANEASDLNTAPESLTLLVVEDNLEMGALMQSRLQKICPQATVAWEKTSLGGQRYLYHHKVNLVFLDLNLEDSYGISSVQEIKAYARKTPIVVFTGLANETTINEALKAGAKELILKTNITNQSISDLIAKYTGYSSDSVPAEVDSDAQPPAADDE